MSIGEIFRFKRRLWQDQIRTIGSFYKNPRFALVDLTFGLIGLFSNPYRVCRRFLQKKGEISVYAYGETPLKTLQKIADECAISESDRWIELGSGRGKGCFWMAHFVGCETIGVEWVPQFVCIGRALKFLFRVKRLSFKKQNMEEVDFSRATAVYLCGTCLDDALLERLAKKMGSLLPAGAKVIAISEPLQDPAFRLEKSFKVDFPWGRTLAYLHHVREFEKRI